MITIQLTLGLTCAGSAAKLLWELVMPLSVLHLTCLWIALEIMVRETYRFHICTYYVFDVNTIHG